MYWGPRPGSRPLWGRGAGGDSGCGLGAPCLLVRVDESRYVAYSQKCTHLSCAVIYAARTKRLECPCHEGYFSIDDGHVLQGPPPRPLPKVELEIRDGEVWATGITVFGKER